MASRRGGRPSKGDRERIACMVPKGLHEHFIDLSERTGASMGDLGAYYIIEGINRERRAQGLPGLDLPHHLRGIPELVTASEPPQLELDIALGVAS